MKSGGERNKKINWSWNKQLLVILKGMPRAEQAIFTFHQKKDPIYYWNGPKVKTVLFHQK
jgi:hypothetical protein